MKPQLIMGKQSQTSSLFSLKEQYLQTHNDRGRLYEICAMPQANSASTLTTICICLCA